jgi:alpha-amylase
MTRKLLSTLLLLSILAACVPSTPTPAPAIPTASPTLTPQPQPTIKWNDDVFYEIFVRSFYDSDGNGIGDFNGITQKLDYLNDGNPNTTTDLGVTGIWLMPIFPSPSYHGYDVTDYYNVNPQYGTLDDFKNLIQEAHKRGIRVTIDMVLNHTSNQNPWFKDAKNNVNSPYRNWYIWSETDPGYKGPWGERVWHSSVHGFYYGIFESFMPDLNYNNPEVTAEMTKVFSFWLKDIGVDGFRLDAAKHLIEEGVKQANTQTTHQWYQSFYPVYKSMKPNAMTIGEVFGDGLSVSSRYVTNKEFDLIFNFQLASTIVKAAQTGRADNIATIIKTSDKFIPGSQYAPFLTNHDQNRTMNELKSDVNKAKVAASILLTSPGTPYIYYGEEIGMTGAKPDENIRRPMQWSAETSAGFTTGKPWHALDTTYKNVNVEAQNKDTDSLLNHYRGLIQLRNAHPALRTGTYYEVRPSDPGIYAALRVDQGETILVLVNLSDKPITDYTLKLEDAILADGTYGTESLFGEEQAKGPQVTRGGFQNYKPVNELKPFSTLIVKLQP